MVYISVVWHLQQISGPLLWMREQVSVPRFMNYHQCSCIRYFKNKCASSLFEVLIYRFWHNDSSLSCFVQDWIMEQWEKNYYISAVAGATNGSSLVVMSKGLCRMLLYKSTFQIANFLLFCKHLIFIFFPFLAVILLELLFLYRCL